jgi:hypothetical protein
MTFRLPLIPDFQRFSITLVGVTYQFVVRWCVPSVCWILDVLDASDAPLLCGVPLVTGCDLLEQYAYLDIGGQLVVQTDSDLDAVPTLANLGSQGNLYFIPDAP